MITKKDYPNGVSHWRCCCGCNLYTGVVATSVQTLFNEAHASCAVVEGP